LLTVSLKMYRLTAIIINNLRRKNLLDLYDLKLSRLVDCLVRLIRDVVKGSVVDFLRLEFLRVLFENNINK